jgi:8-oxo-dGTP pyrophosphatase MutT (NUDIX family)
LLLQKGGIAMNRVPQAGAIIIRRDPGTTSVLVVRAKKTPKDWVFPKGHIEPGESLEDAALREAREETGIRGLLIGRVGEPLEFKSGDELVRVQYFLLIAGKEGTAAEEREKRWCTFSEARDLLSHQDAKELLMLAKQTAEQLSGNDDALMQLALAEFEHLTESLVHNEESGEKRAAFFITLAGAVGAVVGFLGGKDGPLADKSSGLAMVTVLALVSLVLLGYATFLRVVTRNAETDRCKLGLSLIRQLFLGEANDPRVKAFIFEPFQDDREISAWRGFGNGGWLETMALVESSLAGALAATATSVLGGSAYAEIGAGLVVAAVVWWALLTRARHLYNKKRKKWQRKPADSITG